MRAPTRPFTRRMAAGLAGLLLTSFVALAPSAPAAPGDLDPGFGDAGVVLDAAVPGEAYAVAVQPDGKTIVGGGGAEGKFALTRYLPSGDLDPTFGTGGRVLTDVGGDQGDRVFALAIQPDGKIIAGGSTFTMGVGEVAAIARYMPNGALDPTFGANGSGFRLTDFTPGRGNAIRAISLQANGKIVIAGLANGFPTDFLVARYTQYGALDPAFGIGGRWITDIPADSSSGASALVTQPDGKLVAAGSVGGHFALIRYTAAGAPDPSFGSAGTGILTTEFPEGFSGATALALHGDGLVAAGYVGTGATPGSGDFALVRYNSAGQVDTTFGAEGNGRVITDFGADDSVAGVAVRQDGTILAGGWSQQSFPFPDPSRDDTRTGAFAVASYDSDGIPDTTFGGGTGRVLTDISGVQDQARAVALTPDGKLVAAGCAICNPSFRVPGSVTHVAVARYLLASAPTAPQADLALTTTGPATTTVGETVTYTLNVSNNGPAAATGVTVTDTLTGGINTISATTTQGTCTQVSPIACTIGALAPGAPVTITVKGTATAEGELVNAATVEGNETDPTGSNNSAQVTTRVNPAAPSTDLRVTLTDAPDPVLVGGRLTYTVTARNQGAVAAPGVVTRLVLPAGGVRFVDTVPSVGTCTSPAAGNTGTVSCTLGTLAPGASATIRVRVQVNAPADSTLTASADVDSLSATDPNPSNDAATATTRVRRGLLAGLLGR